MRWQDVHDVREQVQVVRGEVEGVRDEVGVGGGGR